MRKKKKKEAVGLAQGHTAQLEAETRSSDLGKSTLLSSAGADSGPLVHGTMPIQAVHTLNQKINQPNGWSSVLRKEHSAGISPWPGCKLTA